MSGLEDLFAQIPTSDIASKIGVDEAEVNKAVQLLVPVLVGGLQENAQDPDHASKIESAADSHAASGLLDGGVSVDQVDEKDGSAGDREDLRRQRRHPGRQRARRRRRRQQRSAQAAAADPGADRAWPTSESNWPEERSRPQKRRPPAAGRSTTCWAASSAEMAGGNKSLGTVLGNALGSKAGDILGGLLGGKK